MLRRSTSVAGLAGVGLPLVVDPVMVAKGGARLLDSDAVAALKRVAAARDADHAQHPGG